VALSSPCVELKTDTPNEKKLHEHDAQSMLVRFTVLASIRNFGIPCILNLQERLFDIARRRSLPCVCDHPLVPKRHVWGKSTRS